MRFDLMHPADQLVTVMERFTATNDYDVGRKPFGT